MGYYSEYLDKNLSFDELTNERKNLLKQLSESRGRDLLVYAADLNKAGAPISIDQSDLLPIRDQLANMNGSALDLIIQTPGGSGEVAEDIVRQMRTKYDDVAVIVPGIAKSAGTIIALSADEILMEPSVSSLGPIDAQMSWQGKVFSAHALLEGLEKIKAEVERDDKLNKAYIPILQSISPGELEHARNALNFAKVLVTDWLANYKFKNWTHHSSNGEEVTNDERRARAEEIAGILCDHSKWMTHGRSIKLADFEDMKLKITDYSKDSGLFELITRYYTVLEMSFSTNIYKIIETPSSQIYRFAVPQNEPSPPKKESDDGYIIANINCANCQSPIKIQLNLGGPSPIMEGCIPYPSNDVIKCPSCNADINISNLKNQIESQTKKQVVV